MNLSPTSRPLCKRKVAFRDPPAFGGIVPLNGKCAFALPTTIVMSFRGAVLCAEAISPLHNCHRLSEDFLKTLESGGFVRYKVVPIRSNRTRLGKWARL